MTNEPKTRWVLRRAAGCCWLVDVGQSGVPYRIPVRLNETGGRVWELLAAGRTPEEAASVIAAEEGLSRAEVAGDVASFAAALRAYL